MRFLSLIERHGRSRDGSNALPQVIGTRFHIYDGSLSAFVCRIAVTRQQDIMRVIVLPFKEFPRLLVVAEHHQWETVGLLRTIILQEHTHRVHPSNS